MHESLYKLALYYSRLSFRYFAYLISTNVRRCDAREFDFVISLIAAGGVIMRSSIVYSAE